MVHVNNFWESLPDGAAIVAKNARKMAFLEFLHSQNRLSPFRFLRRGEFSGRIADDYLVYMKETFGISPSLAAEFVPFFDYLPADPTGFSAKIANLAILYERMIQDGKFFPADFRILDGRPVFAVDQPLYDPLLDRFGIQMVTSIDSSDTPLDLYVCPDKDAEIHAVLETVSRLLNSGMEPDKIKIVNPTADDMSDLEVESTEYGFQTLVSQGKPMDRYPYSRILVSRMSKEPLEALLSSASAESQKLNAVDRNVFSAWIDLANAYGCSVLDQNPDILRHELSRRIVHPLRKTGGVSMIGFDEVVSDPSMVFLIMNYTDSCVPFPRIDNGFLSDAERDSIGLRTSVEENRLHSEELSQLISSLLHAFLFLSETNAGQTNRISTLPLSRSIKAISAPKIAHSQSYSWGADLRLYAKRRFSWERFGSMSPDFSLLHRTLAGDFRRFDSRFSGLTPATIARLLDRGTILSPSSLTIFGQCRFRYFLQYLLKLAGSVHSLELSFGNLSHVALSRDAENPVRFRENADNLAKLDPELMKDARTKVLTRLFIDRLSMVVGRLTDAQKGSKFKNFSKEKVFSYIYSKDPTFRILGKIDLVRVWEQEDVSYTAVIDFKTGNKGFSDVDFVAGTDIQLVFYLHLLGKTGAIKSMKPAGFFYQPLNVGKRLKSFDKDPIREKLKLEGRILRNRTVVEAFDPQGNVRGVAYKLDGDFRQNTHLVETHQMEEYLRIFEEHLEKAVIMIRRGDFAITPISPKPEHEESESCRYCPFQGICFLTDSVLFRSEPDENGGED